jgi:hypothetical protein
VTLSARNRASACVASYWMARNVSVSDDARIVYGWLSRLTTDSADAERLLFEILGRARTGGPACLRTASPSTRLQYLTIESVLRLRGVL